MFSEVSCLQKVAGRRIFGARDLFWSSNHTFDGGITLLESGIMPSKRGSAFEGRMIPYEGSISNGERQHFSDCGTMPSNRGVVTYFRKEHF